MWRCRCDCGNELLVESRRLKQGRIQDCGCSSVKARVDLRGKTYGMLKVMHETERRDRSGSVIWACQCACGKVTEASATQLRQGTRRSCGCRFRSPRKGLEGMRFGKLVVLQRTENRDANKNILWLCRCDCGKELEIAANQLRNGRRVSCGCMSQPIKKELEGQRFGKLTVIAYGGRENKSHIWQCVCDCGKETSVAQNNLQSGHTTSCGCVGASMIKENKHFVDGTCLEQIRSEKPPKNNTSGVRGVYQSRKTGKWIAQITLKGKTHYLGTYETLEEAAGVRKKAADRMYGEILEEHAELLKP